MEKQAIAILSTDKHLNENNALELLDLADQEITLAKEVGTNLVIWLGDIFDSRLSQRQELLTCLDTMLDMYLDAGIEIWCIPGNHDKTDYEADESFLTPYRHHPAFILISEPEEKVIHCVPSVTCHFVPYYSQDVWLKKFAELPAPSKKGSKTLLFSHTAVQGSINNDGRTVNSKIQLKLFKGYEKVFLGHYHNAQQPGAKVFHLPSTRQNNFGEDPEKGFTVLYDDCSHEFVQADFKTYKPLKIDASTVTPQKLKELAAIGTDDQHVQITLVGTREQVKSINKKVLEESGILVKTKYSEIEVEETETAEVLQELSGSDLKQKFQTFCEEKGYSYDEGYELLKEVMKWQE